ncbi:MAG: hypothetical protein ABFC56_08465, partial [Clostridiaceae bacterium]
HVRGGAFFDAMILRSIQHRTLRLIGVPIAPHGSNARRVSIFSKSGMLDCGLTKTNISNNISIKEMRNTIRGYCERISA